MYDWMVFCTYTMQVNLDFSSEQDMVEKFRISLALQVLVSPNPRCPYPVL